MVKCCTMSGNNIVKIRDIDLGSVAKQIDSKAEFANAIWGV